MHALCVACKVSAATWPLFSGARAVCGIQVLLVFLSPLLAPPLFLRALYLFFFCFFLKWKTGHVHTAGTGMGQLCSGAVVLRWPVCVVGALSAVAPQGCGSRFLMYMDAGQGGFG